MRQKILVVEDEQELSNLISIILEGGSFQVITAGSAEEAWEHLAVHQFDAAILDLMLPDMDGISLCELLRKHPRTQYLCIIMLTAWATPQAEFLGIQAGANEYITKPFSSKNLLERLRNLIPSQPGCRCDLAPIQDESTTPCQPTYVCPS